MVIKKKKTKAQFSNYRRPITLLLIREQGKQGTPGGVIMGGVRIHYLQLNPQPSL